MHHTVKNTIVFLFFILMSVAGYSDQTNHNANEDTRHYTQKVFRSQAELVIQKSIKGDCIASHHSDFNATDLSLKLYSSVDDCLKAGGRANK